MATRTTRRPGSRPLSAKLKPPAKPRLGKKFVALSLFWRTFFLLALLLASGVFAWVQTFRALEFEPPREDDFPALRLARAAGEAGGVLPAVLNAANEEAVAAFLEERIPFPRIWQIVEQAMDAARPLANPDLDAILQADAEARRAATAALS